MRTKYNLLWLLWLRSAHWYGLEGALSSWQPVWGKSKCLPQSTIQGLLLALCLQRDHRMCNMESVCKVLSVKILLTRSSQIRKFVLTSLPLPNLKEQQCPEEDYTFSPVYQDYGFICFWSYSPGVKLLPCTSVYKHRFLLHISPGH